MAFPFGGHPTLGDYLRWAASVGCTVNSGYAQSADGKTVCLTRIVSPDGQRWVIEIGTEQHEYLMPTTIGRFDRRLGLTSLWFSLASPEDEDDSG